MNIYLALANEGGGYVFKNANINQLMDIYLAGAAAAGNNNYIWRDNAKNPQKAMEIFLAGTYTRPYVMEDQNKIFVLESFYYLKEWMYPYITDHWNFMLDSGAFTFMNDKKNTGNVDWDSYTEKYADIINKLDIKLFIELDIDSVVGIKEVERLRNKLEKLTNKKSIPVWHKSRGLNYWEKMVKEYNYVAISSSGMYASKWVHDSRSVQVINQMIKIAHKNNTKVHGLGYTKLKKLNAITYDSVDSTAWIYGNRGGYLNQFNGETIIKIDKPKGTRLLSRNVAIHNFKEWVKFQKYAENNL